ncbi:MAG: hypothetical protein HQK81_06240 [Desulfovibrionaceae bacterium]|nr:hypothetical protein [Desulfovibrionaceae bacterium]MBF0513649.1 hypothetical protein [Desulfovibrionaceae bacterium]
MISKIEALEWLAMAVTMVAVWLVGDKHIVGQYLMLAAQILWLVFALARRHRALAIQCVVLGVLTVRAILVWGRG